MTKKKYIHMRTANKILALEGCGGSFSDLIVIKTTKKAEMEKSIRVNTEMWLNNPRFYKFREKYIDLALVLYVNDFRNRSQDLDNIAKIILDSLKKSKNYPEKPYLIEDDNQVMRLLVSKTKRKEDPEYDTDTLVISFREHDPNKQMILTGETINVSIDVNKD